MAIENAKFGKGIILSGGFDLGAKAPLDSRLTVATIEERDAHVTGNRAYDGMLVYVEADKVTYQYIVDAEGNGEWKEFGFNEADFVAHVADDLVTDDATKALSAKQGKVLDEKIGELEEYVGTIPETSEATNIVAWVQEKTSGIATDSALTELTGRVAQTETDIDNIEKDYLKAADKTELSDAIAAEKSRAEGVEAGLESRIEEMEAFWTAAQADGTESNVIDTLKEIQDYITSDESGASDMLASIQQNAGDIDTLEGKMTTVEEKLASIDSDADVNVIEVVKVNGETLTVTDKAVDITVPTGALASKDAVAEGDLESALATKLNAKADQSALESAVTDAAADATEKANKALEDAKDYSDGLNAAMNTRVETLEGAKHTHTNAEVLAGISSEKVAAWDASESNANTYTDEKMEAEVIARNEAIATAKSESATDAQTKATKALDDAKAYADAEFAKDRARLEELEKVDHEHANQAELDLIESGDKAKWDAATEKANSAVQEIGTGSANGTISVDGTDVAVKGLGSAAYTESSAYDVAGAANTALTDAKAYVDQKVGSVDLSGIATNAEAIADLQEVDEAYAGRLTALETASATHALSSDVEAVTGRVSTAESEIDTLQATDTDHTDRIIALETKVGEGFVEIENSEIDAMFATEAE